MNPISPIRRRINNAIYWALIMGCGSLAAGIIIRFCERYPTIPSDLTNHTIIYRTALITVIGFLCGYFGEPLSRRQDERITNAWKEIRERNNKKKRS